MMRSNSIGKYNFNICSICKKHFFQNNKQKYCQRCKPLSKMTKTEMESKSMTSTNLSNDYERLAYLRKLHRIIPKLTDAEKNARLKEKGFAILQKQGGNAKK